MGLVFLMGSACKSHTPFADPSARAQYLAQQQAASLTGSNAPHRMTVTSQGPANPPQDRRGLVTAFETETPETENAGTSNRANARTKNTPTKSTSGLSATEEEASDPATRTQTFIHAQARHETGPKPGESIPVIFPYRNDIQTGTLSLSTDGKTYAFLDGPRKGETFDSSRKTESEDQNRILVPSTEFEEESLILNRTPRAVSCYVTFGQGECEAPDSHTLPEDLQGSKENTFFIPRAQPQAQKALGENQPALSENLEPVDWEELPLFPAVWTLYLFTPNFEEFAPKWKTADLWIDGDETGTLFLHIRRADKPKWVTIELPEDENLLLVARSQLQREVRILRPQPDEITSLVGMIRELNGEVFWFVAFPPGGMTIEMAAGGR